MRFNFLPISWANRRVVMPGFQALGPQDHSFRHTRTKNLIFLNPLAQVVCERIRPLSVRFGLWSARGVPTIERTICFPSIHSLKTITEGPGRSGGLELRRGVGKVCVLGFCSPEKT